MRTDRVAKWALSVWILIVMFALAALSIRHMAALPVPDDESRLVRAVQSLRRSTGKAFIVHVISQECSCSRSLLRHFARRKAFPKTEEIILFAGRDKTEEAPGFRVIGMSADELVSRFGIDAAPVMIALNTRGELQYVGGYYDHPAALIPLDEKIHAQIVQGKLPQPLPVFGCAVSLTLRKSIDPLGLGFGKH